MKKNKGESRRKEEILLDNDQVKETKKQEINRRKNEDKQ